MGADEVADPCPRPVRPPWRATAPSRVRCGGVTVSRAVVLASVASASRAERSVLLRFERS
jgi:hypothetical protein